MRHEVELRVARERLDMCTLDEFLYTPLAVVGFGYGGRHGGRADGADHGGLDSAEMSAEVATGAPTSPPKPATAAASPTSGLAGSLPLPAPPSSCARTLACSLLALTAVLPATAATAEPAEPHAAGLGAGAAAGWRGGVGLGLRRKFS